MNSFLLFGILAISIIDLVVNAILLWYCYEEKEWSLIPTLFNPVKIYQNVKVNWFGSLCLAIFYHIIFLPIAIGYWVYILGWLFYKLCTIGRK